MNQKEPTRITRNMSKVRANSRYSVSMAAPAVIVRIWMTARMAKDIAPVIITVLSIGLGL